MSTETLMVVDDNRLPRLMVSTIVQEAHPEWKIIEAENADDAIDKARQEKIDVFIVDFNMPGRDGLELVTELQSLYPEARYSLLTANVQQSIQDQASEKGIEFIAKPVTEQSIIQFINQ